MKIVIATPLYPPDIGGAAPYVKELAKRLSENHQITIVAYGHLLEKVPSVSCIPVNKQRPLPLRLIYFTLVLLKAVRDVDILYAENGPSVELPVGLVAFFTKVPLIIHIGDGAAHERALHNAAFRYIERFAFRRALKIVKEIPEAKPEILPFEPIPEKELGKYERSWQKHIAYLERLFKHEK